MIECEKITWLKPKYLHLRFLISVVMRSVDMDVSVSLHLTGNAWESELPLMNVCSLFLSQAHKNGGKSIMDENTTSPSTPGLQETCRPCKSQAQRGRRRASLPPLSLRLKTNRGNQLSSQTRSVIQPECLLLLLGFFESDNPEDDTFEEGMEVTCFDPTRRFDPHQWATLFVSVLFFQRLPSALLIQSLPGIPAHIVSALAPLHTCSVW